MFYFHKLHILDLSPREVLILSALLNPSNKAALSGFFITARWTREIMCRLRTKGLINDKHEVVGKLPNDFRKPFILLNAGLIEKFGLNNALLLGYYRGDIKKFNEEWVCKTFGLSRATFYNCQKKLRAIKDIKKTIENVFKKGGKVIDLEAKKKEVTDKHINKFIERVRKETTVHIGNLFIALCSVYGYKQVPHPSRADVAKATKAMINISDIPVQEILERMVSNWAILQSIRKKPKLPDLGLLPICLKEVAGLKIAPKLEKVKAKKHGMKEEDIDAYIEDQYFD